MEQIFHRMCDLCRLPVPVQQLRECSKCHDFYCYRLCRVLSCRKPDCNIEQHATCWKVHLPGEASLHAVHEPIHSVKGVYVDMVTYSEEDPGRQQQLHDEDRVAQWFVVKKTAERPRLCLRDRFRELCSPGLSDSGYPSHQYPGFISFIGETGMGKSTLLRAMILLGLLESGKMHQQNPIDASLDGDVDGNIAVMKSCLGQPGVFPVTRGKGNAGIDHLNSPTSYGVHLYKDGGNVLSDRGHGPAPQRQIETPILYADCEGFRAGYQTTHAQHADQERQRSPRPSRRNSASESAQTRRRSTSRSGRGSRTSNQFLTSNGRHANEPTAREANQIHLENPQNYVSDQIITARSYAGAGKEGVDLFYARLLYTISDVIVFVIRSDLTLLTDLQKLVEWCSAAVHRTVNQVAAKTLVIVRNAANLHDGRLYDPTMLYDKLLMDLAPLWEGSTILQGFRDEHNGVHRSARSQIHTNDHLLRIFFQDVKVCYIPDKERAKKVELYEQYTRLRGILVQASLHSQRERSRAWLQYNTPTLSRILSRAFEHFRTTDRPFDFYDAARSDNPNPASVAEHIENFSRHLSKIQPQIPKEMFTNVVSVCLITQVLRLSMAVYDPDEIFKRRFEAKFKLGLKMFQEKDQTCSFEFPSGRNCILKYAPHPNEHADGMGNVVAGQFVHSDQAFDGTVEEVSRMFNKHYSSLCNRNLLPSSEELRNRREMILGQYLEQWKLFSSNKTCLACLQDAPDHKLSCGHTFCSRCVSDFGTPSKWFECSWVIERCVLCRESVPSQRALFRLQPRCAGHRVLTLDGGGVRGIVEIALLERLEEYLGLEAPMHEFFDLIMGTSTGGIISLGLATLNLLLPEIRKAFLRLSAQCFAKTRGALVTKNLDPLNIFGGALIILRLHESVYPTTPLRKGIIELFGDKRNLFSHELRNVKVAVTAVKDGGATPCFITNYNRLQSPNLSNFEREDEDGNEFKIWEAALATSAAPFWFKPFRKMETSRDYVDGALFANLPVSAALEELGWISTTKPQLDILLSVGTGIQEKEIQIPKPFRIGGFEHVYTSFQSALNTDRTWKKLETSDTIPETDRRRIFRLNSPMGSSYVALDAHKRMQDVYATVIEDSKVRAMSTRIMQAADTLLAALFYFEPDYSGARESSRHSISGSIRCRLERGSPALGRLVLKLSGFWYAEVAKGQAICPSTVDWTQIEDAMQVARYARSHDQWLRIEHTMHTSDPSNAELVLGITLKRNIDGVEQVSLPIPISGFPVTLEELRRKAGYA